MSDSQQQPDRPTHGQSTGVVGILLVGIAVLALAVAAFFVFQVDTWGENGNGLSERFQFDATDVMAVDPKLVGYSESSSIDTGMKSVHAMAVDAEGRVYVAGDQAIQIYDVSGKLTSSLKLAGDPSCIAVAGDDHIEPGRVYVGVGSRIEAFDADGESLGSWPEGMNADSVLTSLTVSEDELFVADAGNRVVLRFDGQGRLLNEIGKIDEERGIRGFVIPSPYFDVAISSDGLLRVSNPGARRIETFTPDGDLLGYWGQASAGIEGFFGCCNPSHFAILPDGRFVTSEKGIPRIKVYSESGEFESVVATPKTLAPNVQAGQEIRDDHSLGVFDIAVDHSGRVFVLDPNSRSVRIFEPNKEGSADDGIE